MPRIKKRGLDYFPMNTDFIHNRLVRRIMKREGDAALAVLVEVLSYIYADEGYYVRADVLFYEDLSANLYEKSAGDVERIINLAVEYGIFDEVLFNRYGILTSAGIQKQYLFSTRRRNVSVIEPAYCLIEGVEDRTSDNEEDSKVDCSNHTLTTDENVTFKPKNVTSGTHSIAQNSVAENSVAEDREEDLLYPPTVGQGEGKRERGEGDFSSLETLREGGVLQSYSREDSNGEYTGTQAKSTKRKEWTQQMIDRLKPPEGREEPRNYEGLLFNLRHYAIPPAEQYAIILKSNFGAIGNPVWKALCTLRDSNGKIKLPGRYLLSVLCKQG